MALRLNCPTCDTSYDATRCGIPELKPTQSLNATVVCLVCKVPFDVRVSPEPAIVVVTPTWWQRVVRRKKAVVIQADRIIESTVRG